MLEVSISVSIGGTKIFRNEIKINPPIIMLKTIINCNRSRGILIQKVKCAFYQRIPTGSELQGITSSFSLAIKS